MLPIREKQKSMKFHSEQVWLYGLCVLLMMSTTFGNDVEDTGGFDGLSDFKGTIRLKKIFGSTVKILCLWSQNSKNLSAKQNKKWAEKLMSLNKFVLKLWKLRNCLQCVLFRTLMSFFLLSPFSFLSADYPQKKFIIYLLAS